MAPPPEGFERRIPYPEKFFNTLSPPGLTMPGKSLQ
jgi:hypothetical protein